MTGTKHPDRRGFVLVMALALIALVALALAGMARQSLALAAQASSAQSELQRRWGAVSCRKILLPHAEALLEHQNTAPVGDEVIWPLPGSLSATVALGGLSLEILLSDEDAKANLNSIYRREPRAVAGAVSMATQGGAQHSLMVKGDLGDQGPIRTENPLRSWGQLLEPMATIRADRIGRLIRESTHEITCWGSGRLNVRRATEPAVRLALMGELSGSAIQELLKVRSEPNLDSWEDGVKRLDLKEREKAVVRRLVTDRSTCYALWITTTGTGREWTSLTVGRRGGQFESFVW